MIEYLEKAVPVVVAIFSLLLGSVLLARTPRSLLQKALLYCIPGIVMLQLGVAMLLSTESDKFFIYGGRLVIFSLCILTPLCSRLALHWGTADERPIPRTFRIIIAIQWLAAAIFTFLITSPKLIYLTNNLSVSEREIAFGDYGQYFLMYLLVSCVLIMSIFERKLRVFDRDNEIRIPTIIFLAIFFFFIIEASQGLLIKTLNRNVLVIVSVCILLGYLAPLVFRFKMNFDRLLDKRESVYSSVLLLCIGGYLVLLGIIAKIFVAWEADIDAVFSVMVAAAAIILFVALITSHSVKKRLRVFVDRVVYGGQFDYRAIWHQFSEETSFLVKPDELTDSVLHSIMDIVKARSGAILLTSGDSSQLQLIKKKISSIGMIFSCQLNRILLIGYGGSAVRSLFQAPRLRNCPNLLKKLELNSRRWMLRYAFR